MFRGCEVVASATLSCKLGCLAKPRGPSRLCFKASDRCGESYEKHESVVGLFMKRERWRRKVESRVDSVACHVMLRSCALDSPRKVSLWTKCTICPICFSPLSPIQMPQLQRSLIRHAARGCLTAWASPRYALRKSSRVRCRNQARAVAIQHSGSNLDLPSEDSRSKTSSREEVSTDGSS